MRIQTWNLREPVALWGYRGITPLVLYGCYHNGELWDPYSPHTLTAALHSTFELSANKVQLSAAIITFLPPPAAALQPRSVTALISSIEILFGVTAKLGRLWGRRYWGPKCHPLWCVVDNETGRAVWITELFFHFLNLCPKASPVTLSHYFPPVCLLLDHIDRPLWRRIKKGRKNPQLKWRSRRNSISLIKTLNKSAC